MDQGQKTLSIKASMIVETLISVTHVDPKSSSVIFLQFWTSALMSSSVTFSRNRLSFSILSVILLHRYVISSESNLVLSKLTSVNSRQLETTILIDSEDSPAVWSYKDHGKVFSIWIYFIVRKY